VFVAPVDGGSGNSRVEPVTLESIPPADHIPSPKDTANGEVVVSDLAVSTERRAPEGQDNDLDGEFQNDSKTAPLGTLDIHCISVTAVSRNLFLEYMNPHLLWLICVKSFKNYTVS
jgi:hypothetical protein